MIPWTGCSSPFSPLKRTSFGWVVSLTRLHGSFFVIRNLLDFPLLLFTGCCSFHPCCSHFAPKGFRDTFAASRSLSPSFSTWPLLQITSRPPVLLRAHASLLEHNRDFVEDPRFLLRDRIEEPPRPQQPSGSPFLVDPLLCCLHRFFSLSRRFCAASVSP